MKIPEERMQQSRLKRAIPNILTCFRMAFALLLLIPAPLSGWFLALYALAGLTDFLDGFFARRWNAASNLGAKLDSAADFLLCVVLLVVLIPYYSWPVWVLIWIGGIAAVRLVALAVCLLRFRQAAYLHTYANKATGVLLFLTPFLLRAFSLNAAAILLCAIASLSALEELLILLSSDKLRLNQTSIFVSYPR